jgi:hypothetical protein
MMNKYILIALAAALLFGASMPSAKMLSEGTAPVMLPALLYLGSGFGLFAWKLLRRGGTRRNDACKQPSEQGTAMACRGYLVRRHGRHVTAHDRAATGLATSAVLMRSMEMVHISTAVGNSGYLFS